MFPCLVIRHNAGQGLGVVEMGSIGKLISVGAGHGAGAFVIIGIVFFLAGWFGKPSRVTDTEQVSLPFQSLGI